MTAMKDATVRNEYFKWLCLETRNSEIFSPKTCFDDLLLYLYEKECVFMPLVPNDDNRIEDGKTLRYHFSLDEEHGFGLKLKPDEIKSYLIGPCSVLEMLVALAKKMEGIMWDSEYGDRISQWFWKMINSLGLSHMYNEHFDEDEANAVVDRFLRREYEPTGKGGLFTLKHCRYDLRTVEIWYQMGWYINELAEEQEE